MAALGWLLQRFFSPGQRQLRWFFALRENPTSIESHTQMVQAAVLSAAKHTRLLPHFLYDGNDNALTDWLAARNIPVIRCRTQLEDSLQQFEDEMVRDVARGTFLRLEIPRIMRERGWDDRYVFYTDCDVLFLKEVVPQLLAMKPAKFAVAPQTKKSDFQKMNAGVMLLNVPAMSAGEEAFIDYCRTNMKDLRQNAWDQGAYRAFYAGQWDKLPPEFNWKPYWGGSGQARIIHFHGPKPFQAGIRDEERATELVSRLATGDYQELSQLWKETVEEARAPR